MEAPKEFIPVTERVLLTWQQIRLTWKWAAVSAPSILTLVIRTLPGLIIARKLFLFLQASIFGQTCPIYAVVVVTEPPRLSPVISAGLGHTISAW